MTPSHPQLSALFERALEVPTSRRAGFLDSACGQDDALRRELESLLVAHDSASGYFEGLAQRVGVPALADAIDKASRAPDNLLASLQSGLADTYRIERELGGGGMSRVFLAEEVALKRRVVIKTLPPEMAATVNVDRFRREIEVIAQLQHPHIVPLLAANASGLLLYYTMPFVAGESLRDRLAVAGALPVEEALKIWRDVLDALAHAHAGSVVHRDIKPANILLSGRHAMVADFGIARAIEAAASEPRSRATMTGPIGTPAYMAPEQASGAKVDHRADLYAAGLVMYEMLAARLPFEAASAREFVLAHIAHDPAPLRRADVPAGLTELVMRCLAKAPDARPASAEALLAEIDSLPARLALTVTSPRRKRTLSIGLLAAALALGAFGAWRVSRSASAASAAHLAPVASHVPSDSVMRLYQRAMAEQRRRSVEGASAALGLFDRAIATDSDFMLAWAGRARTALFASSRGFTVHGLRHDSLLAIAVRSSRRAVQLDSSSAEAWTVAGRVAAAVDPEDRAATLLALRRALSLDSTYSEAWFEFGRAQEELLRPAEAERAWLRAAALNPANTQALAFLGLHYLWYDDYATGRRWADSAVAVDPTFFLARDAGAFLALAMRDTATAIRHAEASQRATGHEPPIPFCILATAAARAGDMRRARRYVLQAESVLWNKKLPELHEATYLGAAWAAIGDTARAIRWLSAYHQRTDLHYQLHLKRDPDLRWIATVRPALLTQPPR